MHQVHTMYPQIPHKTHFELSTKHQRTLSQTPYTKRTIQFRLERASLNDNNEMIPLTQASSGEALLTELRQNYRWCWDAELQHNHQQSSLLWLSTPTTWVFVSCCLWEPKETNHYPPWVNHSSKLTSSHIQRFSINANPFIGESYHPVRNKKWCGGGVLWVHAPSPWESHRRSEDGKQDLVPISTLKDDSSLTHSLIDLTAAPEKSETKSRQA